MSYQNPRVARIDGDPDAPTCTIHFVRNALGRSDYGDAKMVSYVEKLISDYGFPPPLPSMKGKDITGDVTPGSRWFRDGVLAWLADFLPPDSAAAVDRHAQAAAAEEMDAAAGNLRLVAGGRA